MYELLKIETKDDKQLVSARELHQVLEVKRRFSLWVSDNFKDFIEDEDFTSVRKSTVVNNGAKRDLQDYALTLSMAKELCMMSHTELGKKYRKYLIDVEKKYKQQLTQTQYKLPQTYHEALVELAKEVEKREKDKPKVEYFDRCMKSKGLTTTTKIAKEYGMTGRKLNQFLNDKKIIYKRGDKWYVFQKYSNDNLTGYDMRVDKRGYHNTLKWTPKGEKFVKDLLEDEGKLPVSEQPNQMIIEEPKVEYDGKYYTASEIAWRMHLSNEWVRKIGRIANDLHLKPVYTDENKYCRRVIDKYGRESYEYTRYGARILEEYINNEVRQEILDYINEKNRLNK